MRECRTVGGAVLRESNNVGGAVLRECHQKGSEGVPFCERGITEGMQCYAGAILTEWCTFEALLSRVAGNCVYLCVSACHMASKTLTTPKNPKVQLSQMCAEHGTSADQLAGGFTYCISSTSQSMVTTYFKSLSIKAVSKSKMACLND